MWSLTIKSALLLATSLCLVESAMDEDVALQMIKSSLAQVYIYKLTWRNLFSPSKPTIATGIYIGSRMILISAELTFNTWKSTKVTVKILGKTIENCRIFLEQNSVNGRTSHRLIMMPIDAVLPQRAEGMPTLPSGENLIGRNCLQIVNRFGAKALSSVVLSNVGVGIDKCVGPMRTSDTLTDEGRICVENRWEGTPLKNYRSDSGLNVLLCKPEPESDSTYQLASLNFASKNSVDVHENYGKFWRVNWRDI